MIMKYPVQELVYLFLGKPEHMFKCRRLGDRSSNIVTGSQVINGYRKNSGDKNIKIATVCLPALSTLKKVLKKLSPEVISR